MEPSVLQWARDSYLLANVAAFGFFLAIESGDGAMLARSGRVRHVGRNVGLWLLLLFLTDVVVLGWWLEVPKLLTVSDGLLTPFLSSSLAQFVLGFLLIDLYQYGFHVASHRFRWLWRLHAVHHSDTDVDASTALRFHPLEAALQYGLLTWMLLLLGVPLWVEGARAAITNPLELFQHTNHAFPAYLERLLGKVFITPPMHRLHHSTAVAERDSNYGVTLKLWDQIFGTYQEPLSATPQRFGVEACDNDRWQTVTGMLLTPLRLPAEQSGQ